MSDPQATLDTQAPDTATTDTSVQDTDTTTALDVDTQDTSTTDTSTTDNVVSMENWRQEMSGEDEKLLKQLGRYNSISEVGKALQNAQDKIRKGNAKALSDEPTDDELKAYREDLGIPQTHEEYDLTLDEGLIIGDDDKPIVDSVVKALHGAHAKPEQVKGALNAYFTAKAEHLAALTEKDNTDKVETTQALKEAWGADINSNKNAVSSLVNQMPEEIRDNFLNARMADGTALFNNADAIIFFSDMARKLNPASTVVPNTADPAGAIKDEIATLEGMMGNKKSEYWKGPKANDNQARLRELYSAQESMNK